MTTTFTLVTSLTIRTASELFRISFVVLKEDGFRANHLFSLTLADKFTASNETTLREDRFIVTAAVRRSSTKDMGAWGAFDATTSHTSHNTIRKDLNDNAIKTFRAWLGGARISDRASIKVAIE